VSDGPVVEIPRKTHPCPVHGGERRRGRGCRCRHKYGSGGRRRGLS
jgi:hypothetical protein